VLGALCRGAIKRARAANHRQHVVHLRFVVAKHSRSRCISLNWRSLSGVFWEPIEKKRLTGNCALRSRTTKNVWFSVHNDHCRVSLYEFHRHQPTFPLCARSCFIGSRNGFFFFLLLLCFCLSSVFFPRRRAERAIDQLAYAMAKRRANKRTIEISPCAKRTPYCFVLKKCRSLRSERDRVVAMCRALEPGRLWCCAAVIKPLIVSLHSSGSWRSSVRVVTQ
jgi:hypothetical protein